MKSTTYTIHRGVVRSAHALHEHRRFILMRASRAGAALSDAISNLVAAEKTSARMSGLVEEGKAYGLELARAKAKEQHASHAVRAAQSEQRNAIVRANEVSRMHLAAFAPPYVPAKASRVYPALKTCTSPRRAFRWKIKTGRLRYDPTIAAAYPTI